MNHRLAGTAALILSVFALTSGNAEAQTGKCYSAKDVVAKRGWDAINYTYSPKYIEDHRAELQTAVEKGADVFFQDCQSNNLSNEQILLQGTLDVAAMPIKNIADKMLEGLGLPPTGDKALHIDVKAIEKKGIFGGPNSVFRKPFG